MDEPNQDAPEVLEIPATETEVTPEEPHETAPSFTPEQIAELQMKAAQVDELEAKNKKLFERLKKAPLDNDLSALDAVAMVKADVHDDDIEQVIEFAKFKKLPVREALKQPLLQSMLKDSVEMRRTAQATTVKGGTRIAATPKPEDFLAKAERGEIVDSDEGMKGIFQARLARKFSHNKR